VLDYVNEIVKKVEENSGVKDRDSAFLSLRQLGLDDFGEVLMTMPNALYPKLSAILPAMSGDAVQKNWTGNSGLELLKQTSVFVRTMSYAFSKITGRTLENAKVLDFGCGYGRIARLMYFFTESSNVYGVDPLQESIMLCHDAKLGDNFLLSEYLPESLPVGSCEFDLIYAFSVFTHLSERATLAALGALRRHISPDGVLVITIRPVEYWHHDQHTNEAEKRILKESHHLNGFAFNPHNRVDVDGETTYGDTSMTVEWISTNAPNWAFVMADRSLEDPLQRYIFLRPVK
jgi:SAM-dependent methyltransferase